MENISPIKSRKEELEETFEELNMVISGLERLLQQTKNKEVAEKVFDHCEEIGHMYTAGAMTLEMAITRSEEMFEMMLILAREEQIPEDKLTVDNLKKLGDFRRPPDLTE